MYVGKVSPSDVILWFIPGDLILNNGIDLKILFNNEVFYDENV